MTFDEALGEAVTGHNVTSPCIPEGSWIEYEIGKGWSKVFPNGDRSGVVFDDIMRAAEWFYWREPTRDGWGKVTYPTYSGFDATLKTYDEERTVQTLQSAMEHAPELPPRPSAPWGNETVLYRDYEVYRDTTGAMLGFGWQYVHKDYDGPEVDNRGGVCKTFTDCLDEIDEVLDD
ncbi:hypothetical protein [Sphingomonas phage Kimi]|nr:hypothetical protein [Sphingomonas phage Kimi]